MQNNENILKRMARKMAKKKKHGLGKNAAGVRLKEYEQGTYDGKTGKKINRPAESVIHEREL